LRRGDVVTSNPFHEARRGVESKRNVPTGNFASDTSLLPQDWHLRAALRMWCFRGWVCARIATAGSRRKDQTKGSGELGPSHEAGDISGA